MSILTYIQHHWKEQKINIIIVRECTIMILRGRKKCLNIVKGVLKKEGKRNVRIRIRQVVLKIEQ